MSLNIIELYEKHVHFLKQKLNEMKLEKIEPISIETKTSSNNTICTYFHISEIDMFSMFLNNSIISRSTTWEKTWTHEYRTLQLSSFVYIASKSEIKDMKLTVKVNKTMLETAEYNKAFEMADKKASLYIENESNTLETKEDK